MSSKFNELLDQPITDLEEALLLLTKVSHSAAIWLSDESLQTLAQNFCQIEEIKYSLEDQKDV